MVKAILFDFDGTIANTIPAIREGVNNTMRLFGYPEHTDADILAFINHGARELIRQAMPINLQADDKQIDLVLQAYNGQYGLVYDHTKTAYDGIPELLATLHGEGYKIGVLSNKQDEFVKKLCRQVLFPSSYGSAHGVGVGQPTKPNPFLPHLVAKELGVSPADCVMVGDSDVDIQTAKNADMHHIGVSWGYRNEAFLLAHGAKYIAHTPNEVKTILEKEFR